MKINIRRAREIKKAKIKIMTIFTYTLIKTLFFRETVEKDEEFFTYSNH